MKEAQRQRYLKALGLTPWVARRALPGAAASPLLDWEEETEGLPAQVAVGTPVAAPQRPAPAAREPASMPDEPPRAPVEVPRAPNQAPRAPVAPAAEAPAKREAAPVAAGAALTFTLEAHLAGDAWVVFQQEDPQAPGLGRHTGALAGALLAVFGATPARPRRFYCPLTDEPMDAGQARQALEAFFSGLARQNGGARVLLCLDETLTRGLFEIGRYRPFNLNKLEALAISTLAEMLEDPARHKGDSWRAMREQGFDGRHE